MSLKIIGKLFITLSACLSLQTAVAQKAASSWHEIPELKNIFKDVGATGTFVLLDQSTNTLSGYNQKRANTRLTPASTFKIPNSLIALETGVVKDENQLLSYEGMKQQTNPAWKQAMTLKGALAVSNLPLYQHIAHEVGEKRMHEFIQKMNYGNKNTGKQPDKFWYRGPLAISAVEQVYFLANINQKKPPFSNRSYDILNKIMPQEKGKQGVMFYKTGWAANSTPNVGWFVGWVKSGGKTYSFAMNMDINYKNSENELPKRVEIVRKILQELKLL